MDSFDKDHSIRKRVILIPAILGVSLGIVAPVIIPVLESLLFSISLSSDAMGAIRSDRYINDFALSPDGKNLVTVGSIKTNEGIHHELKIWDLETQKIIRKFMKDEHEVNDISFLDDGNQLASAHVNGDIKIWNFQSGQLAKILSAKNESVNKIIPAKHGHLIASVDTKSKRHHRVYRVWDAQLGTEICNIDSAENSSNLAYSPKEDASVHHSLDQLKLNRLSDCTEVKSYNHNFKRSWHKYIFSGSFIAHSTDGSQMISNADKTLELWHLDQADVAQEFKGHSDTIVAGTFTKDGNTIITSGEDNTIKVWDVQSRDIRKTIWSDARHLSELIVSPDGKTLFTRGPNNQIQFWNIE